MAITVDFLDNYSYGASELNAIGVDLMAPISTTFTDDVDYGVDELNDITANLINKGVFKNEGSGCIPVIAGGGVKIQSGLVVFGSGVKARIDTDGVVLPFTAGVVNYVYLVCDTATNTVEGKCETVEPVTGDFVMIGEVSAAGVAVDKRQFAYMKNASVLPNVSAVHDTTLSWVDGSGTNYKSIEIGTGYRFAKIETTNLLPNESDYFIAHFDLDTGVCFSAYNHSGLNGDRRTLGDKVRVNNYRRLGATYNNGDLELEMVSGLASGRTLAVRIEVI